MEELLCVFVVVVEGEVTLTAGGVVVAPTDDALLPLPINDAERLLVCSSAILKFDMVVSWCLHLSGQK